MNLWKRSRPPSGNNTSASPEATSAFDQATALCDVAGGEEAAPNQREALADQIGDLLKQHETSEIACTYARALSLATAGRKDMRPRDLLAARIGEFRRQLAEPENVLLDEKSRHVLAQQQASALATETLAECDGIDRKEMARQILSGLSTRHVPGTRVAAAGHAEREARERDIALQAANIALGRTLDRIESRRREALTDRIGDLIQRHELPEIAFYYAEALRNATALRVDAPREEALTARIEVLLQRRNTPKIALCFAQALQNAILLANDEKRRVLVERLEKLLKRHKTPEIALICADALKWMTVGTSEPWECEAIADRIAKLRKHFDTPAIAEQQAVALNNAAASWSNAGIVTVDGSVRGEHYVLKLEALADRVGELSRQYDTPEIAVEYGKSLVCAIIPDHQSEQRRRVLTNKLAALMKCHETPELAKFAALVTIEPAQAQAANGEQRVELWKVWLRSETMAEEYATDEWRLRTLLAAVPALSTEDSLAIVKAAKSRQYAILPQRNGNNEGFDLVFFSNAPDSLPSPHAASRESGRSVAASAESLEAASNAPEAPPFRGVIDEMAVLVIQAYPCYMASRPLSECDGYDRIREIGQSIHQRGGNTAMQEAAGHIVARTQSVAPFVAAFMNKAWNGIGGWRA